MHSLPDSGPEEERKEVGDDERVDDLLGVASRRRRPLLAAEAADAVEGSAGGVVGAQLARRRRFPTSDNVGEFPIPAEKCKFRLNQVVNLFSSQIHTTTLDLLLPARSPNFIADSIYK